MSPNERKAEMNPRSWGLDRILLVLTLCATIFGGASVVFNWGGKYIEVKQLQGRTDERIVTLEDRTGERLLNLETSSKDVRGEIEGTLGNLRAQSEGLDKRVDAAEATLSRLSDRQSAADTRLTELASGQRDVLSQLNKLVSESSAMSAILARIEAQAQASTRGPK